MYRINNNYNSLNLKDLVIPKKHSKKKNKPKVSKRIFESKMKAIDKDINFAGAKS